MPDEPTLLDPGSRENEALEAQRARDAQQNPEARLRAIEAEMRELRKLKGLQGRNGIKVEGNIVTLDKKLTSGANDDGNTVRLVVSFAGQGRFFDARGDLAGVAETTS